MVIIKKERIRDIPLLHIVQQENEGEQLPLVIFIHGFESIKERNVQYAYMLAEKGYRVILPDALYHGERVAHEAIQMAFWRIVLTTIHELNSVKDEFVSRGLVDGNRIGVAGTSMGAIVTLGAMTQYDWIRTGVSLMGTPSYMEFARYQLQNLERKGVQLPLTEEQLGQQLEMLRPFDASIQVDKWAARPLMFWHGARDEVVPYRPAYTFYKQLQDKYNEQKVPLSFILDEHADHNVSNKVVVETVNWFVKHL